MTTVLTALAVCWLELPSRVWQLVDRLAPASASPDILAYACVAVTTVLATLLGLVVAFLIVGRQPPRPGHCQNCGYNLTGNVSGTCPECGDAV